jgi:hypothetical protein
MPTETTIPSPLSGAEIKTAILDKISQALDRDCYLHPASAYDFFSGTVTIDLSLSDMGTESKVRTGVLVQQGTVPVDLTNATHSETTVKFEKEPPNQVRVESGQAVPTDTGKKISYSRQTKGKGA